jgi:hypothetical protein
MKILRSASYGDDMTIAATLTGITILEQGKYRKRHGGSKELIESYPNELITKSEYNERYKGKVSTPRPKKKQPAEADTTIPLRKKVPNYKINKKEVTHRIRNFTNQMQGEKQLYFWTVTFPEGTTDDTAFILLNKWLTRLRRENMLRSYLWVSERQQNNTIHFHIALHNRMCVKKANRYMRACLFTCIDNDEIKYNRQDALRYNGVDIAKNRKTNRVTNFAKKKSEKTLVSYLTKYVTKNDSTFTHLAWHSSRDYSNLIIAIHITMQEYLKDYEVMGICADPTFSTEWFKFYKWKGEPPKDLVNYLAFINNYIVKKYNPTQS